jgi:methylmalonyl-CoA/ethylmalonyl-CoA epimerase
MSRKQPDQMVSQKYNLTFHHTGCLPHDIEGSKAVYSGMGFSTFSETFFAHHQKVKVCFIEMYPNVFLELVEPTEDNVPLIKMLKNKVSFYHLGFLTNEFDNTVRNMQKDGFYFVNRFMSKAFSSRNCAFLYTPEMQLIEIIER